MPDLNDVFGYREGRPTHPHFAILSDVVLKHDGKTEDADFDIVAYLAAEIDPDSLTYMAMQRAMRQAALAGIADVRVVAALASMFTDGFMTGVNFRKRRAE